MMSVTQGWIHSRINQVRSQLLSGQMPSYSSLPMFIIQHTNCLRRPARAATAKEKGHPPIALKLQQNWTVTNWLKKESNQRTVVKVQMMQQEALQTERLLLLWSTLVPLVSFPQ